MRGKILIFLLLFFLLSSSIAYGKDLNREYKWNFLGSDYSLNFTIPQKEYSYYKIYPGGYRIALNSTYLQYFLTPNDRYLEKLAGMLRNISEAKGFDNLTEANFVLSFVQDSIEYKDDYATTGYLDYYKFPIETLYDGYGDCEDKSLLLATLLHILGYDVILITMRIVNENVGHVAVGINLMDVNRSNPLNRYLKSFYYYDGKYYYYMESTSNETRLIGHDVHYYVGVSPEEAGFILKNMTFISFGNYHYSGYTPKNKYVKEIQSKENFPWFAVYLLILSAVFIPLFIKAVLSEKKRCPHCGKEVEESFNYCPYCGYWLRTTIPPPPKPPELEEKNI